MTVYYESAADAWSLLLHNAQYAHTVSPRGMPTYELIDTHVVIHDPSRIIASEDRDWKYGIAAAEALALVGQVSVPEVLTQRFSNFGKYMDDGVLWGSYGPRIAGSLGQVVKAIQRDNDTRQAVLSIFDSHQDVNRDVADVPCTIAIQFLLRGDLRMRVMMRSNDLWLGFPYDTIQFFALQAAVAEALHVEVGQYSHIVGSMHLYKRDLTKADRIVRPHSILMHPPFWGGTTIGETSTRARLLLLGHDVPQKTEWETWLQNQLQ